MRTFLALTALCEGIVAVKLYENATLPADITAACSNALLADVSCDVAVAYFEPGGYYNEDLLRKSCTDGCTAALQKFEKDIVDACGTQTFGGEENWDLTVNPIFPVAMIPNKLRFYYGLACLKDNGRFCNLIAGEAAAASDQDGAFSGTRIYRLWQILSPAPQCVL
jgi:hypothetical protein